MIRFKNYFSLSLLAFLISTTMSFAQTGADALVGLWSPSSGKARVQIFKNGEKYLGRIVWLREPNDVATGKPKLDKNNSEESKRGLALMGYLLLQDFVYDGDNLWDNGTIYDPENGSTYKCKITMPDANTLDVRGYIGVSLFGRTDTWKRIQVKK